MGLSEFEDGVDQLVPIRGVDLFDDGADLLFVHAGLEKACGQTEQALALPLQARPQDRRR